MIFKRNKRQISIFKPKIVKKLIVMISSKLIREKGECQDGQQTKFISKIDFSIPILIMAINFMDIVISAILLVIREHFVK